MSLEKIIKYSVPFFAFAIVSRAIEEISFIYYAVPVMCVGYIAYSIYNFRRKKVEDTSTEFILSETEGLSMTGTFKPGNHLPSSLFHHPLTIFLLPGIWFLVTALWSSYPTISAMRALYFILLSAGCISAGILWIRFSGKSILDFLLPANIFIVLLSLFSLITNIPSDSLTGGHGKGFMSFFGHQNALASVLLFTLPGVFFKLLSKAGVNSNQSSVNRNQKSTTYHSLFTSHFLLLTTYYLLLTTNLLLLILTYSRASILSLIFGVVIFLFLNKKWKILSYSFSIAALFALIIFITPPLKNFTEDIINKDFPEFYSSRMWMWEPSYRAAIDGGLIGLGYGMSDPNEKAGGIGDHYEGERFVREKGNSALAMIEETGVIGLVLFLFPVVYLVGKLTIKNRQLKIDLNYSSLLILNSSLAAMLLHSQFEAWWVGVGSVQLPLFFIYIGLIAKGPISQDIK